MSVEGLETLAIKIMRYANQHPEPETQTRLFELHHLIVCETLRRRFERGQAYRLRYCGDLINANI